MIVIDSSVGDSTATMNTSPLILQINIGNSNSDSDKHDDKNNNSDTNNDEDNTSFTNDDTINTSTKKAGISDASDISLLDLLAIVTQKKQCKETLWPLKLFVKFSTIACTPLEI